MSSSSNNKSSQVEKKRKGESTKSSGAVKKQKKEPGQVVANCELCDTYLIVKMIGTVNVCDKKVCVAEATSLLSKSLAAFTKEKEKLEEEQKEMDDFTQYVLSQSSNKNAVISNTPTVLDPSKKEQQPLTFRQQQDDKKKNMDEFLKSREITQKHLVELIRYIGIERASLNGMYGRYEIPWKTWNKNFESEERSEEAGKHPHIAYRAAFVFAIHLKSSYHGSCELMVVLDRVLCETNDTIVSSSSMIIPLFNILSALDDLFKSVWGGSDAKYITFSKLLKQSCLITLDKQFVCHARGWIESTYVNNVLDYWSQKLAVTRNNNSKEGDSEMKKSLASEIIVLDLPKVDIPKVILFELANTSCEVESYFIKKDDFIKKFSLDSKEKKEEKNESDEEEEEMTGLDIHAWAYNNTEKFGDIIDWLVEQTENPNETDFCIHIPSGVPDIPIRVGVFSVVCKIEIDPENY